MQNLELARTVLSNIQQNRNSFEMSRWGIKFPPRGLFRKTPGGYQACLAGHTLIAAGYEMIESDVFRRGRELVHMVEIPVTAKELLGLTKDEYYFQYPGHEEGTCTLFCGRANNRLAVGIFNVMIEAEQYRQKLITAA